MKLLDSTVLVDLDRGGPGVGEKARRLDREGRHAISAVTVTELAYGVETAYRDRPEAYPEAVGALETLVGRFEVVPVGRTVAVAAAQLMHALKREGKALDDLHDLYIAATAQVHRSTLLTADRRRFGRIEDLVVEDWTGF